MKRNFIKILNLLMMLTVLCSVIFALNISANAASDSIRIKNVTMRDGQYLKEGANAVTTTKPSSDYAYYKSGVLYLYNFDLTWNGLPSTVGAISTGEGDLIIELSGTNTITSSVARTIVGRTNNKVSFRGSGSLTINSTKDYAIDCGNLEVTGGTLNVNATGTAINVASYIQTGGTVTVASTKDYEAFFVEKNVSLAGGSLKITGNGTGIRTTSGNVEIGRCDVTMKSVSTGIDCAGNVTINGNGITKITATQNGISCKNFNVTKTGIFLVSGQSGLAVSSSNKSWTVGSDYATSVSTNYQGKDAVPLSNQSAATAKYFYTRVADVYIAGIPVSVGDYLPKNGNAASTYKLSDNCVSVQLNGERTKLTFYNFDIAATGSMEGIKAATGIEICGSGTLNITSQSAQAILMTSGSLAISHSGTVNIKSASNIGIVLQKGSYIQNSGTVNVEGKQGLVAANGDVTIKKGRLNIYGIGSNYSGIGLSCKNVKVDGGCLDAVGVYRALMLGGKLTADSSLYVLSAATSNSPLGDYNSGDERVFVGDHICYGAVATCQTPMKCTVCGKTFDIYGNHNWSTVWDANTKEGHAHKCKTKGCTATTTAEAHTPGAAATETKDQTCTTCGYIITPKLRHTHSLKKFSAVKATCEKNGNAEYYACTGCSKIFQDAGATKEYADVNSVLIPATGHKFAEIWSMDASGHWYACTTCGAQKDKVIHSPGVEATATTDQTCSVCGYVIEKAISHTHTFGDHWFSDASAHWHACACGEIDAMAAHADEDGDYTCDACYWVLSGDETTDPTDGTEPTDPTDSTEPTDPTVNSDESEPNNQQSNEKDQSSAPVIVVIVLAVVFLVVGTALAMLLIKRKKS